MNDLPKHQGAGPQSSCIGCISLRSALDASLQRFVDNFASQSVHTRNLFRFYAKLKFKHILNATVRLCRIRFSKFGSNRLIRINSNRNISSPWEEPLLFRTSEHQYPDREREMWRNLHKTEKCKQRNRESYSERFGNSVWKIMLKMFGLRFAKAVRFSFILSAECTGTYPR